MRGREPPPDPCYAGATLPRFAGEGFKHDHTVSIKNACCPSPAKRGRVVGGANREGVLTSHHRQHDLAHMLARFHARVGLRGFMQRIN